MPDAVDLNEIQSQIAKYREDLQSVAEVFNRESRSWKLGIKMSADRAVAALSSPTSLRRVKAFSDAEDDTGKLHEQQLITAVEAIYNIVRNPAQPGLILGAMQSGKTTTSLALQFAGPILYMITGEPLYPFYMLTNHTSQEAQTKYELERFLDYYGHLTIEADPNVHPIKPLVSDEQLNPYFTISPTLDTYRETILQSAFEDTFNGTSTPEDFVMRRAWGSTIPRIAKRVETIAKSGFFPLMIIDEPQYGVLDRVEVDPITGEETHRASVFKQIFGQIEERLEIGKGKLCFVATSATPFELHDLSGLWNVHQRLGPAYRGFNFFGGNPITDGVVIEPPELLGFTQFAQSVDAPFFSQINVAAMDNPQKFATLRKRIGFPGTQEEYRAACIDALSRALRALAARHSEPIGVCVRAMNDNYRTRALAADLRIEDQFEILHYNGIEASGKTVKRIVAERQHKDRPYLLLVTNRARMGDAFPRGVRYFIEFASKFSDINAMMQGLIGRACGYHKDSTVIVSDWNAQLVRDLIAVEGGYIYKTSRGSVIVGFRKRGRPTVLVTLRRERNDDVVERFFAELDTRVVSPRLAAAVAPKIRTKRLKKDRFAPLLKIAEDLGVFDYIEQDEVRGRLLPNYPMFRIARAQDTVPDAEVPSERLGYSLNDDGDCLVTFREYMTQTRGGIRARGSSTDRGDKGRAAQRWLEPQILLRKHDPVTDEVIDDHDVKSELRVPGVWRAYAVVLPLISSVQQLVPGTAALPRSNAVFDSYLSEAERQARDRDDNDDAA